MEKIIKDERALKQGNENVVVETVIKELPRYSVNKVQADDWFEGGQIYDYLVGCLGLHFCLPEWKGSIHEIDVSKDSDNPFEDFKKQVAEKYGDKFNYYWVHELRHSGISFTIAECPHSDTGEFSIRNWDTSNVGFVAVPKDSKLELSTIGNMLTDLWEGTIDLYEVYDNYHEEIVDSYEYWFNTTDRAEWNKTCKEAQETYGVDLESADND